VEPDSLVGWFGQIYLAMASTKYFGRDGKLDVSKLSSADVPQGILDAYEQRAAAELSPKLFTRIVSGQAERSELLKYRLKPVSAVPLDRILRVLEAVRRNILGSA
jgi:hypothetical protein